MKGKNIFRIIFLTIFILFTTLYVIQALGYYEYSNRKTNQLTEEAVRKFDADIKAGKNVKASDYIKKENDYNNNISRMGLSLSNTVGDIFNGVMNFIFSGIDKTVNG